MKQYNIKTAQKYIADKSLKQELHMFKKYNDIRKLKKRR